MNARESIRRTLLAFRSGELTATEATDRLIASACDQRPQFESLVSLLRRLGDPPADVVAVWREQLQAMIEHVAAESPGPLPTLQLQDLGLADSGCLIWRAIRSDDPSLRHCPQRREEVQRLTGCFERHLAGAFKV